MTEMTVSAHETGKLRVFAIDLPRDRIAEFTSETRAGNWPLRHALGASLLRSAHLETLAIEDLGDMPLSSYLAEGYGLSGEDFDQMRAQLDALSGHVLLVRSSAFGQVEQGLSISAPLRWIATFSEESRPADLTPLRSTSARGTSSGESADAPADKGGSRLLRILMVVLGVVVLGALALMLGSGQ